MGRYTNRYTDMQIYQSFVHAGFCPGQIILWAGSDFYYKIKDLQANPRPVRAYYIQDLFGLSIGSIQTGFLGPVFLFTSTCSPCNGMGPV